MNTKIEYTYRVEPGKPGAEVWKGKNYTPKKDFAYNVRRATNQCDAQTEVFARNSLRPFHGGDVP